MAKKQARRRLPGNEESPLSGQPWWVRALVWVGVPTAIAGYLLWFVLAKVDARLDGMATTLQQHKDDAVQIMNHLTQESDQSWVMQGTLARICINTARTDADRLACVSVSRRTP